MDNQPNSSTTARIPDNNNTSQSSNNNHPQNTPIPESTHEYPIQPAHIQILQPVPKGSPPAPLLRTQPQGEGYGYGSVVEQERVDRSILHDNVCCRL